MNRPLLILILLLSSLCSLQAQSVTSKESGTNKSYMLLGIDAGYSVPLGDYASLDTNNDNSGYASGGFLFQVSIDWMGKHYLGLGLSYAFQWNKLDPSMKSFIPDGQEYELGTLPWNNHYLLAGPCYNQTFGKISVGIGARIGAVVSRTTNFWITLPDSSAQTISEGVGFGVAYQFKGGIGIQVSPRVTLNLAFSYLGGSPSRTKTYSYVIYDTDSLGNIYPVYQVSEAKIKKAVSTFNTTVGVTIKL